MAGGENKNQRVLKNDIPIGELRFYQKAGAIFQLTLLFYQKFLPEYGGRVVDRMVQTTRSGKQDIMEGLEDEITSVEVQLKLLNVARGSLQELREGYEDCLYTRRLGLQASQHKHYDGMLNLCRTYNLTTHYIPLAAKRIAEEYCNTLLTLRHLTDRMMCNYLKYLEKQFVKHGGIKECMCAARTGYRKQQDRLIQQLKEENLRLKAENSRLKEELLELRAAGMPQ